MTAEVPEIADWPEPVARLRQALDKDEFVLYGQPMRALREAGTEPMAELLVRLQEEEKALSPPGEFLPVLEHYKMMPELDGWVMRRIIRRLSSASQAQRFSINVARQTLEHAQLPKLFAERIKFTGVRPASIMFEIDESELLHCAPAVAAFAKQIRVAGGGIVVDGFGRKSLSFAPLEALRPDYVKVDGTIIRGLLKSPVCARRLDAILSFCRPRKVGLIAECVEEDEVLARLKQLGVDYAQGFGIARPRPLGELLLRDASVGVQRAAIGGRPRTV